MADTTAPTTEQAPSVPATEKPETEQTAAVEASAESTTESTATMSGALQSPDTAVTKAPDATEEAKVNGDATEPAPPTESTSEKPAETTEDSEMKDAGAEDTTAPVPTDGLTETNGTPASEKKQQAKRKSVGGVPEHKGKKLNKKKSMPKMTHLDAKPGEYYFARLKSYPPWPSVICDEEMLPTSLLSTRPVTTMQADGTYKEAYADGGKRVHERTFPIMFLYTNEFAWIPNTDLTPLTPEECKDVPEKGKSKSLLAAYAVAAEGKDLKHYKDVLLEHQRALEEDQEIRDALEAEKAAKAAAKSEAKKKRKSVDAAATDADVDMEDVGGEEAEAKPKSSKKRKKEAESGDDTEKPAKTPKTATKLKLTTPKAPAESSKKSKDSAKPAKTKTPNTKKAKAEEDAKAKEAEKPLDPAELKARKEREVLWLRHKLQKGFLAREQAPKEDEMETMSGYIKRLEDFEDLEVSIIRATKVNKVLKAIIKLNTIPKDEEFNFRKRSHDLLESWNKLLGADTADAADAGKDDEPTTNGHKEDGEAKDAEAKEEAAEAEPAPKVAAPTDAADVAEEKALPEPAADAKETIVDGMVDGTAASGAVAAEADKPAEEVKNDAEETEPSTKEAPQSEMEGVENTA